jgi:hypothetical protein
MFALVSWAMMSADWLTLVISLPILFFAASLSLAAALPPYEEGDWESLRVGLYEIVHRGACQLELIRRPEGSFLPWHFLSMVEGHRKRPCEWSPGPGEVTAVIPEPDYHQTIEWTFRPGPRGLLEYTFTVTNTGGEKLTETAFNLHNFPEPRLFRGEKTYVEASGALCELRDLQPPPGKSRTMGIYPFTGADASHWTQDAWTVMECQLTGTFVCRAGGGNEPTPHARWCERRPMVMGITAERIRAVLANYDWPCLDLSLEMGTIGPGESRRQRGLIGITEGTVEDFVAEYRRFHGSSPPAPLQARAGG